MANWRDTFNNDGAGYGVPDVVLRSSFPQYAYGTLQAAYLAKALGHQSTSVIELGVAGGNGLVELEKLSTSIGHQLELEIACTGFDLGQGMPAPVDYRDTPYIWQENFFKMDEPRLRSELSTAELIIGDVESTGPTYVDQLSVPIGFISFDLEYYSSTVTAFQALLNDRPEKYLPRVFCYFDDTVGPHEEFHSEFTGELLAINEFNESHSDRKITKISGLRHKMLPYEDDWVFGMYVLHMFKHEDYNKYVYHEAERQFPLDSD
jgi:hypothetical protein